MHLFLLVAIPGIAALDKTTVANVQDLPVVCTSKEIADQKKPIEVVANGVNDFDGLNSRCLNLNNITKNQDVGLDLLASQDEVSDCGKADGSDLERDDSKHSLPLQGSNPVIAAGHDSGSALRALESNDIGAVNDNRAVQADQGAVQADQGALQADQGAVQADQGAVQADQGALQADQGALQADQGAVQADQGAVQADQGALQADQGALQADRLAHKDVLDKGLNTERTAEVGELSEEWSDSSFLDGINKLFDGKDTNYNININVMSLFPLTVGNIESSFNNNHMGSKRLGDDKRSWHKTAVASSVASNGEPGTNVVSTKDRLTMEPGHFAGWDYGTEPDANVSDDVKSEQLVSQDATADSGFGNAGKFARGQNDQLNAANQGENGDELAEAKQTGGLDKDAVAGFKHMYSRLLLDKVHTVMPDGNDLATRTDDLATRTDDLATKTDDLAIKNGDDMPKELDADLIKDLKVEQIYVDDDSEDLENIVHTKCVLFSKGSEELAAPELLKKDGDILQSNDPNK